MYINQGHHIQEFDMSHSLFSILGFLRWPFVGLKMSIFDRKVVKMATRPKIFFFISESNTFLLTSPILSLLAQKMWTQHEKAYDESSIRNLSKLKLNVLETLKLIGVSKTFPFFLFKNPKCQLPCCHG